MSNSRFDYEAYLRSPEWAAKKRCLFQRRGRRCERCGSGRRIEVHHKTYERLGCELEEDLEVLCGYHHDIESGVTRPYGERCGDLQRLNYDDIERQMVLRLT